MLADRLKRHVVEVVCGPMTGGAFLAQMIAMELQSQFAFAERVVSDRAGLFPVDYRIAPSLRDAIGGKRVAVVDDAISAGSAVRGTLKDLGLLGGTVVAIGALIVVGDRPALLARERNVPLESLAVLPNNLWLPTECPMCALGAPLSSS